MTHPTKDEWNAYVAHRLAPDKNEQLEGHLFACDRCLSIYMRCVAEQSKYMPVIADGLQFTENVLAAVKRDTARKRRIPFYQRPIFHYGAAAIITLILMSSGVFQQMLGYVSHVDSFAAGGASPSLSDHLLERAINVINLLDPTTRGEIQ